MLSLRHAEDRSTRGCTAACRACKLAVQFRKAARSQPNLCLFASKNLICSHVAEVHYARLSHARLSSANSAEQAAGGCFGGFRLTILHKTVTTITAWAAAVFIRTKPEAFLTRVRRVRAPNRGARGQLSHTDGFHTFVHSRESQAQQHFALSPALTVRLLASCTR